MYSRIEPQGCVRRGVHRRGIIWGILVLLALLLFSGVADAQLMDSAWAKFHHDLNNTGQSPYASTSDGTLKWSYVTGSQIRSSVVVDKEGILYFGGIDRKLYALYPNGTQKWNITFSSSIYSTPAIDSDNETIYVAEESNLLHAIYKNNGTEKWNIATVNSVIGGLSIGLSGTIYVPTGTGLFGTNYLYAIYPNGTIKWNFAKSWFTYSTPAIDTDEVIYIGSGSNNIHALYPNGTQKWTSTGGYGYSSPLIYNDILVIGGNDHKYRAIYKDNGTQKWVFSVGDDSFTSPAIDSDGIIYVGSADNKVHAIYSENGTEKWNITTDGKIVSASPILDLNKIIYIGNHNGSFYAIYPNGTQKWKVSLPGRFRDSTPSIDSNGVIYIGNTDTGNKLYAFDSQAPAPSSFVVSCPIGWCYLAQNYTNKTLLELDNLFSTDIIQGHYNATSQKYESHRTGYNFNQNVTVAQKEGYYYYFTSAQDITTTPGSTPSITLNTGWNLVANYGNTNRTLTALKTSIGANATQAQYYDRTYKLWVSYDWQEVPAMESFMAYVTNPTVWTD